MRLAELVLPSDAMVAMTVFDFDTGPAGEYSESLTIPEYAYFKTPLRSSEGGNVPTTVYANSATRTFTGTGVGTVDDSLDLPVGPQQLTDEQASKGVQFFFRPRLGYIEATYSVSTSEQVRACRARTWRRGHAM